jgi:hypothetical protein
MFMIESLIPVYFLLSHDDFRILIKYILRFNDPNYAIWFQSLGLFIVMFFHYKEISYQFCCLSFELVAAQDHRDHNFLCLWSNFSFPHVLFYLMMTLGYWLNIYFVLMIPATRYDSSLSVSSYCFSMTKKFSFKVSIFPLSWWLPKIISGF